MMGGVYREVAMIGPDLAKNVFQVHGADSAGLILIRKPLALLAMQQKDASLPNILGDPKGGPLKGELFDSAKLNPEFEKSDGGIFVPGGGIMPASAVGAGPAGRRTEARTIGDKEFREGTKIAGQSDADLLRTVELVYKAVKHLEFKDTGGLEREIRTLLDMFDKSGGVRL